MKRSSKAWHLSISKDKRVALLYKVALILYLYFQLYATLQENRLVTVALDLKDLAKEQGNGIERIKPLKN